MTLFNFSNQNIQLTGIELIKFKRIETAYINIAPINLLVGGNNSGKSSILQGIHFSVVAGVAARITGKRTFTQQNLLYCPTRNFVHLRHEAPYQNQSNFSFLHIQSTDNQQEKQEYSIRIYRARNEGNVGCQRSGDNALGYLVTNPNKPFSIYAPGLAGVPQKEEFRTESIIRKETASGDANLYLRNILYLIKKNQLLKDLTTLMRNIFPGFSIDISFRPKEDVYIDVKVSLERSYRNKIPLELAGTGVQQALQIFSYSILFSPSILLLDEPDSHLHPDNQSLLANILVTLSHSTNTKVLASTHSRHLVEALYDEANIVWLKNGTVYKQGYSIDKLSLLMDLGALDSVESLMNGTLKWVFLTEDSSKQYIKKIVKGSGFKSKNTAIQSYRTSSQINSAIYLAEFIKANSPETEIIIHRDRDFLIDEEVQWVSDKIENSGAHAFITELCDIESYFIDVSHLCYLLEEDEETIEEWLSDLATQNHTELICRFLRKRDEAKSIFRNSSLSSPDSRGMLGDENPLPPEKRLGKFMLKKVNGNMKEEFGKSIDLTAISPHLKSPCLIKILGRCSE